MPRTYKRKRLAEEQSLDMPPRKIKKQINSSERWRAKREIEKQIDDSKIYDPAEVNRLRWSMEAEHNQKCYEKEMSSPEHYLSITMKRLGLVGWNWTLYKCTCENIDKLSDEEILRRNGYL